MVNTLLIAASGGDATDGTVDDTRDAVVASVLSFLDGRAPRSLAASRRAAAA